MIKASDYIADLAAQSGINTVFMLTGGGAMHLNNSFGQHDALTIVHNHHEQASAMAAESYARLCGKPALVNVTTGPGGINTLNGVYGAFTDSVPMVIVSGQVRYDTTIQSSGLNLRQLGDQEVDIVAMATPVTKYAVMITDPNSIRYHFEKAIHLCRSGRPGPVWLDVPMNIQGSFIDPAQQLPFHPTTDAEIIPRIHAADVEAVYQRLHEAKRPVILCGFGVRISNSVELFSSLVNHLKIPVVTAWNSHDIVPDETPYYVGRPGSIGDRAGNYAVQNADLLLVLGNRLNIRQISYNYTNFARAAYKIMVDIDAAELKKPTLTIDQPIHGDVHEFIDALIDKITKNPLQTSHSDWLEWCLERRKQYPVVLNEYWNLPTLVNPYCLAHTLGELLDEGQITVTGDGTACVTTFQSMTIKKNQRLYTNSGSASMGYDLPAAIGACIASNGQKIVCIAGDGSIMQNLQELAVISYNHYPIKIIVLNNNGYHSIRQTQRNFFGSHQVGCGPESGLPFPKFENIAKGFDLPYVKCENHAQLAPVLSHFLSDTSAGICEVFLTLAQDFAPKTSSQRLPDGRMISKPLEDLAPFLDRDEFRSNMIIPILEEA